MIDFENKYRVDVIDSTSLRLTIMNIEVDDTGTYVFFRDVLEMPRYSVIVHGKHKRFYGKFTACFGDTAWRDAHSGVRMCSSVAVAGV